MCSAPLEFSPYEASDKAGCLELFDSNMPKFFAHSERDEFVQFLERAAFPYLVGREHGTIVAAGGYAPHKPSPGEWVLCWGMVESSRHRQGLGRRLLLERLRLIAETRGVNSVEVNTSQHSAGFFSRFGFETIWTIKDGFAPGIDRYEMRLSQEALVGLLSPNAPKGDDRY